jgi:hypothetical protein
MFFAKQKTTRELVAGFRSLLDALAARRQQILEANHERRLNIEGYNTIIEVIGAEIDAGNAEIAENDAIAGNLAKLFVHDGPSDDAGPQHFAVAAE